MGGIGVATDEAHPLFYIVVCFAVGKGKAYHASSKFHFVYLATRLGRIV
jgi:hypothetical protein